MTDERTRKWVGLSLSLIAFGILFAFAISPEPRRQPEDHYYSYEGGDIPQPDVAHPTPDERIATYTGLLVLVGALTAFAILRQISWMRRTDGRLEQQINLAETTAEREQRGYVFSTRQGNTDERSIEIVFINSGKTPVSNVEVFGYISMARTNAIGPLLTYKRATAVSVVSLGPGGEHAVPFKRTTTKTQRIANAMYESTRSAEYIHGYVRYHDAFHHNRTTWFKYRIVDDWLRNCSDGNDWT